MKTPKGKEKRLAWYYYRDPQRKEPSAIMIGPTGFGNNEFQELELVETAADRLCNPFYMEAECACTMRRHGLEVTHEDADACGQYKVHRKHIDLSVPGVTTHFPPKWEYIEEATNLLEQLRNKFNRRS